MQIANLVLLDEIKRIDAENKFIKSKFDDERGPDYYRRYNGSMPF